MADWNLSYDDMMTLLPKLTPRVRKSVIGLLLYVQNGGGAPAQNQIDWCTLNLSNVSTIADTGKTLIFCNGDGHCPHCGPTNARGRPWRTGQLVRLLRNHRRRHYYVS